MLVIIKNNNDPDEYDDDEEIYEYHALQLMRKSYKQQMTDYYNWHPNMEILLKINYSPNSMNLWNHIKTQLKKKTNISGCKINLEKKNSENKFISHK